MSERFDTRTCGSRAADLDTATRAGPFLRISAATQKKAPKRVERFGAW